MTEPLSFAYTPDPDDAFHYYALETGRIAPPASYEVRFEHAPIQALNESCRAQRYDVCAISSVFYPEIDDNYIILASGASVGRGYGPVLGCHRDSDFTSLAGRRVAIPGRLTTGYFLLRYFYDGFVPVPMPFDAVAEAIVNRDVDAGVLIHEELLNYTESPIRKLCCLGKRWFQHARLPLPVGLVVARRSLGIDTVGMIENLIWESMSYALAHPQQAMAFASRFGRGPDSRVRGEFVEKFANADTLLMPDDVRLGLGTLFNKAYRRGFIDHLPLLDLVDPALPAAACGNA